MGAHDHAVIDELVDDLLGGVEQAAGVVSEVQYDRPGLVGLELVEGLPEVFGGGFAETGQTDVADLLVRIEHVIPLALGFGCASLDAGDLDHLALENVILDRSR